MKKRHKNFTVTDILDWVESQIIDWQPRANDIDGYHKLFFSCPSQHIKDKSFRECCQQAMLMEITNKLAGVDR